jgi:multimeric flavodoxin WrbA
MNVLILNGGPRDGRGQSCKAVAAIVSEAARDRGHAVTAFELDGLDIKPCRACFACWLKHPGTCAIQDGQEPVLRAMAAADLQVWITPVTFGGYSSALKKSLDRLIPNALPYFTKRQGEVHHPPRYERRRGLVVIGTTPEQDTEAEAIFRDLVGRNAINLPSVVTGSHVFLAGQEDSFAGRVQELLGAAEEAL